MEPSRELFAFIDSCNEAQCTGPKLLGSVVVVTTHTFTAVSTDGKSRRFGLTQAARTKRSVDEADDAHVRFKRSAADQVFVAMPDGE